MATLKIKDLSDSTELDREAMRAIVGGARENQPWQAIPELFRDRRLVDYPPGVKPRKTPAASKK